MARASRHKGRMKAKDPGKMKLADVNRTPAREFVAIQRRKAAARAEMLKDASRKFFGISK